MVSLIFVNFIKELFGPVLIKLFEDFMLFQGFSTVALRNVCKAKVEVSHHKVRLEANGLLVRKDSLVVLK